MNVANHSIQRWRTASSRTLGSMVRWAWQGVVDIGHNSLALLGIACIGLVLFFSSDSALRHQLERHALEWLNLRHGVPTTKTQDSTDILVGLAEPDAVDRATARHLKGLPRHQALVATWLARRYRVAPEAVARLVQEAWTVGTKAKVEPTMILAIIAIESSFNPFAQSQVGAQGLMQVMTSVHDEKYAPFGGTLAAFDPLTNLRVGVQVLRDCMARAGGDIELGLKYYVGAANLPTDGGYANKVLGEHEALLQVAAGAALQPTANTVRNESARPSAAADTNATANRVSADARQDRSDRFSKSAHSSSESPSNSIAPAAHASVGTVIAPAVGAALAVNLSTTTSQAAVPAPTLSASTNPPQAVALHNKVAVVVSEVR
jgi:Transglycosylase SLT domain